MNVPTMAGVTTHPDSDGRLSFEEQLGRRIRMERQLHEASRGFNSSVEVGHVFEVLVEFAIFELDFERCLVLEPTDDAGVYRLACFEGYFDPDESHRLQGLEIELRRLSPIGVSRDHGFQLRGQHVPTLAVLAEETGLRELAVFCLGRLSAPAAIVVAGNSQVALSYKTPMFLGGSALRGLATLVSQASVAVNNCQARAALQHERENLEERVRERTAELEKAMSALQAHNVRMVEDLREAHTFQRGLVSPLPHHPHVRFAALHQSAAEVGGDFYDVYQHAPGFFRVFIADATGHGVRASLLSMVIRNEYERLKRRSRTSSDLLSRINRVVYSHYAGVSANFVVCCVDIQLQTSGEARLGFASAGLPPMLKVDRAATEAVESVGRFVGESPDTIYQTTIASLTPGQRAYVFTDGVYEQQSPTGKEFGYRRLIAAVEDTTRDLHESVDHLSSCLAAHRGDRQLDDDVTVVGFEVVGAY